MSDPLASGLFGLAGVLVGAMLAGIMELWRVVTSGRSAAALIRAEVFLNYAKVQAFLDGEDRGLSLSDGAWFSSNLQLAPILPYEPDFKTIAVILGIITTQQEVIEKLRASAPADLKAALDLSKDMDRPVSEVDVAVRSDYDRESKRKPELYRLLAELYAWRDNLRRVDHLLARIQARLRIGQVLDQIRGRPHSLLDNAF